MTTPEINRLNKQTHAELKEFHTVTFKQEGGTEAQAKRLQQALNSSPILANNINSAISKGVVKGFRIETNSNNNGSFSPSDGMIRFNTQMLNDKTQGSLGNLVFVTAHETRHSLDKLEEFNDNFNISLQTQAQQDGQRDYTDEVKAYVKFYRGAEAKAEIDGFNAVVDMIKQRNSKPTLGQIYEAAPGQMPFFIERNEIKPGQYEYKLRSNLQLDKNMYLPMSTNIEGMGKNFFDDGKFAHDYPDYYGSDAIRAAIAYERHYHGQASKIHLNMQELAKIGIDKASLKKLGVDFNGIDTAPPKRTTPNQSPAQVDVADPSSTRLDAMLNRVNRAVDAYQKNDGEAIRAANHEMIAASPVAQKMLAGHEAFLGKQRQQQEQENRLYSLENMPQRAQDLHGQIQEKFTAYVKEHNLPYSERGIQNSIGALTSEAYAQKLSGIDHLAVNNGKLSAMQEGRVVSDYASVDVAKAAATPERESFKEILQSEQNLEREAEQREMARQMEQSRGMGMSR